MILLLIFVINCQWPKPQHIQTGNPSIISDPCQILFKVSSNPTHLNQIVQIYRSKIFNCKNAASGPISVSVFIGDSALTPPTEGKQSYFINMTKNDWTIKADFYVGLVRALQTMCQLIYENKHKWYADLPILITDYPDFPWRAVMIDSARHFLSINSIKETIDGMMRNKLNVMHWHLSDDDSFSIQIKGIQNLTKYGSFPGQVYTQNQIKDIIIYALKRGIRIIPQLDSPSHLGSWGRSLDNQSIVLKCSQICGQFDPTMNETYEWVKIIFQEIFSLFPDNFVHLGGDQVDYDCWGRRTSIKLFMDANNMSSYKQLQLYYRKKQKQTLKAINQSKSFIYWGVFENDFFQDDDYVIWWGNQYQFYKNYGNKSVDFAVAFYDRLYLDVGFWGYSEMRTWRKVYQTNLNLINIKGKLKGIQACLWTQMSNSQTQLRKIFPRASASAQRGWNSNIYKGSKTDYVDVVNRLSAHIRSMRQSGIHSSPVTVQLCQRNASNCFPHA